MSLKMSLKEPRNYSDKFWVSFERIPVYHEPILLSNAVKA